MDNSSACTYHLLYTNLEIEVSSKKATVWHFLEFNTLYSSVCLTCFNLSNFLSSPWSAKEFYFHSDTFDITIIFIIFFVLRTILKEKDVFPKQTLLKI